MTNTELVHAWFDNLWHRGVESTIDEILAPDIVAHGLGAEDLVGPDQFRAFYRAFRSAFPAVRVTLAHVLESGDYAVCQADVKVMAADGRGPFRFHGSVTFRIRDGQFVEGWNNFDFLSLLTGMGAVRPDAMATALATAAAPIRSETRTR
jgi:ketosteroid isomerase-like protein